ncbi:MAG: UDP-N-acetylglucosamine 2-epimerase (non-hydrolyzing) [Bacteroidetes bacterium]|jgi:UDP-N-acetylglucosamine 2-epimerase (non-hydrolysing)|nr:UDP-N-acetylglucosamine 2-epimerase (non-hydrolyzing) [Bacteroidota bacterium]
MIVTIVAGARPNFMKIAPIIKAIKAASARGEDIQYRLVHTGQHYDKKMSGDFFEQLGIPDPDVNLECGGGTQAEQTAGIMVKFEKELMEFPPEVVLVVGDVTSTMACSIAAKKLCIDVVHVEAGIRSGDMTMPEEINRIVTDSICDHYYTTTTVANKNLENLQVPKSRIHFVGNTMIDTLMQNMERLRRPSLMDEGKLTEKNYFLLTLHRPSNVDDAVKLESILTAIMDSTADIPIIFPVHPRTRNILNNIQFDHDRLIMIDPLGYLEFIYLVKNAKGIITDSGGITEEATVLHVPCLTLRNSTERPETVTIGTNELIGDDIPKLRFHLGKILAGEWKKGNIPEFWDGKTSERIVASLLSIYSKKLATVK